MSLPDINMDKLVVVIKRLRRYGIYMREFYVIREEGDENIYLAPKFGQPFKDKKILVGGIKLNKNYEIVKP